MLYALAVIAVAVIVLAVTEIGAPTSSARTSREVVTAGQGVVQSTVTGSGNIAAGTDVEANFNTSGTLQDVYVHVGQHVNAGQLLADLDPTSAQLSLSQAQESLTAAEDNLSCLQGVTSDCGSGGSGSGSSGSGSSGSTSGASYSGSAGTVEYAAFHPDHDPEQVADEAQVRQARLGNHDHDQDHAARDGHRDRSQLDALIVLGRRQVVGQDDLDPDDDHHLGSLARQHRVGPGLGVLRPGRGAQRGDRGQQHKAVRAGERHDRVAVEPDCRRRGIRRRVRQLSVLERIVLKRIVRERISGSGTTAGSLGGSGSSGSSSSSSGFAEIINTNTLTMTVAFSESDISKVHVGQSATVTLDALAGVQLAAHVSSISLVGTTSSSVVSYDATLTLDQNDSRVKPGMSASAAVIVGQASGVTLPNQAVSGTGSLGTVSLMKNGKTVSQQVVVGLRGDSRTQIISGLKAGDQVVVTIALPSSNSTSTGGSASGTLGRGLGGAGGLGGGAFPGGGGGAFLRRAAGGG